LYILRLNRKENVKKLVEFALQRNLSSLSLDTAISS
jgi:hypothetical protein